MKATSSFPSLVPTSLTSFWPLFGLCFCQSCDGSGHLVFFAFVVFGCYLTSVVRQVKELQGKRERPRLGYFLWFFFLLFLECYRLFGRA